MKTIIYGTHTATGDALDVTSYIGETLENETYQWWNFNNNANSLKYGGSSLSTPSKLIWGFGFNGTIDTNGTMKVNLQNYGTILINKKFNASYNANAIITGFVPTVFTATIYGNITVVTGTISEYNMVVTGISSGTIIIGMRISGVGITSGTTITGFTSGTNGGAGTYTVSNVHNISTSTVITGSTSGNTMIVTGISSGSIIAGFVPTVFTGSISNNTMTVTGMTSGSIISGMKISGIGITAGTAITGYGSGIGGVGTYTVSNVHNIPTGIISITGTVNRPGMIISGTGITYGTRITAFVSGTEGGAGTYTVSNAHNIPSGISISSDISGGVGVYTVSPAPAIAIPDTFMYLDIDATGSVTGNSLTSNRTTTLTLSNTPYYGWGKWMVYSGKDLVIFDAPITFNAAIDTAGYMTATAPAGGTIKLGQMVFGNNIDDRTTITGFVSGTNSGAGIYIVSPKPSVAIPTGTAITARALLGSIISSTSTTSHTLMVAPNLNAYPVPANSILYAYSLGTSKINGSPVFTVVDNHPVLICTIENTTAKNGYSAKTLSTYVPQINSAMVALHGSNEYQIISPDLSTYKNITPVVGIYDLYDNLVSLLTDNTGSTLLSL